MSSWLFSIAFKQTSNFDVRSFCKVRKKGASNDVCNKNMDVSNLVHVVDERHMKLNPKSLWCVLICYDIKTKTLKCYYPPSKKFSSTKMYVLMKEPSTLEVVSDFMIMKFILMHPHMHLMNILMSCWETQLWVVAWPIDLACPLYIARRIQINMSHGKAEVVWIYLC